jgi:hypothetical protein
VNLIHTPFLYRMKILRKIYNGVMEMKKSILKPGFAGTDPQHVKQEIKQDVMAGNGDKTSHEYGHMQGDDRD